MKMAAKSVGFTRGHKEAAGAYGLDKAAKVSLTKLKSVQGGPSGGTGRMPNGGKSSHSSSHNSGY